MLRDTLISRKLELLLVNTTAHSFSMSLLQTDLVTVQAARERIPMSVCVCGQLFNGMAE